MFGREFLLQGYRFDDEDPVPKEQETEMCPDARNKYLRLPQRNSTFFYANLRRLIAKLVADLQSEYVMQVEWEKSSIQELDVTATDLSTECLIDMLTRIPGLRFLSAGQLNGFNDSVLKAWAELGNPRNLIALDLDSSDNLNDDALHKFLSRYGHQLWGLALSGMPHITDQLWQSVLPILTNAK